LLSKHLKKPPNLLAEEIAKELSNEDFQAEPLRGFYKLSLLGRSDKRELYGTFEPCLQLLL